jgi:hypothetical protein
MKAFIDEHRERFGVEPICEVLQVAPSAYWRHAARRRNPAACRILHTCRLGKDLCTSPL